MKPAKKGLHIIQYLFFGCLGAGLLYLAFKNQSLASLKNAFDQVDWRWPLVILAISITNHISRAMRWKLLIAPLGYRPTLFHTLVSLMFGYFVNLAVPRLGEISRSETLRRLEKVPFKPSFGTVIIERIIDIACLALVAICAIAVESDRLYVFYMEEVYPHLNLLFQKKTLGMRIAGISTVIALALGLAFFLFRWKKIRKSIWGRKVWIFSLQIWRGVLAISSMPNKWVFIGHTLFIWLTYYLMTWLWFFCFEETSQLGWQIGLAIMLIGTVARTLPIQGGGIGAYHYLFAQGMLLYGVAAVYGQTLAIMIHSLQLVFYLLSGSLCLLYITVRLKLNQAKKPFQ